MGVEWFWINLFAVFVAWVIAVVLLFENRKQAKKIRVAKQVLRMTFEAVRDQTDGVKRITDAYMSDTERIDADELVMMIAQTNETVRRYVIDIIGEKPSKTKNE